MNRLVYLFLLTAVACTTFPTDVQQLTLPATQPVVMKTPADTVLSVIRTTFPGWHLCTQADYDKSFWSFCDTTQALPWYTTADIDDDGDPDIALLLKQEHKVKLLLLLSSHTGYGWQWAEDFSLTLTKGQLLQFGLLPEPPGQIDIAYPSIQSLILHSNGISLYHFENRHALYYWNGNRVAVFKTS